MSDERETLEFEDERGANRPTWIALSILVAAVLWMGSGFVFPPEDADAATSASGEPEPVSVATRMSSAEKVTLFFQAEGQAQPDRETAIRAETSGEVAEVLVEKGEDVTAGQVLARLTTKRLRADLARAEEELDRAEREFRNAEELLDRGVATVDRLASARAALAGAEAQFTAAEDALDAARIEAPFNGRLDRFLLDQGEFVSAGSEVGRVVDIHPLTVSFEVPQLTLPALRGADSATVNFVTGEERDGQITFIASSASSATRTFLAEVVVPNEDGQIAAGISAELRIATGEEEAHFVSPSIVAMGADGVIGVKVVSDGRVVFHEVEVVRAEVDGVWVTGLPNTVELITIGQGFVRDGEAVQTRPETDTRQQAATQ
ncbi:MAG: efflux RND transporter periplasmic adaptor subunit [Paracoccaceae bacterium]